MKCLANSMALFNSSLVIEGQNSMMSKLMNEAWSLPGKFLYHSSTWCVFFQRLTSVFSKTSFEKNCFSAWASTLNMGLINKVDMVCLSPVGYGV